MVKAKTPLEPVGRQLVFTAKAMREAFEDALETAGGSLPSWVVLNALAEVGCLSQAALASHVHLEGATITHHIDKLESAGLVRRVLDPADRRVRRLELTEAGAELHHRMLAEAIKLQRILLAGLTAEDRAALARCLAVIQGNLASASAPAERLA
jgi:MarR family transcriptional regulator, transcriptional regulator for hemolysin